MIPIQNIYHMLAYAFQILNEREYIGCGTEKFENAADLMSAILAKGVSGQIKRGLGRSYVDVSEALSSPRGKIDISASVKRNSFVNHRLFCTYDEFSVNSYINRVLKSTMQLLLHADIPKARKQELRRLLVYFKDVGTLDVHGINWGFRFDRGSRTYQLLMSVCYLVIKGLLQTDESGAVKLNRFLDEQEMHRLYERFILEYYRKHYPQLNASASQIAWAVDDGVSTLLPIMRSDIMLTHGRKALIIDAKYYEHSLQTQYGTNTIHSNNLYQIFTYVKNKAAEGGEVSGMLLYARTDDETQPDNSYLILGSRIEVKALDLNCDFALIASQLNSIADSFINTAG